MEDSNNQAAPEAIAPDNAAATTDLTTVAGSENTAQNTTDNTVSTPPAFNPQTSYDALVKQLEAVNKNYGNLRSEYTRRTQHESAMKQQIDSLHKAFEEATRQEISPEEFIKSLQTQGIKAFDPLKTQWTKELQEGHNKALQERDQNINALNVKVAVMVRKSDTENYPDFAKLMPVMNEIASSDNCPVDWNQDVDVIYDTLYKLARDVKAEESVKQAHALGRKEADAQSAKEASTAVAAGGKTNTTGLDPRNMSASDLKKHFAKLGMISD